MDIKRASKNILIGFMTVVQLACGLKDYPSGNQQKEAFNKLNKAQQEVVIKANESNMPKSALENQVQYVNSCSAFMKKEVDPFLNVVQSNISNKSKFTKDKIELLTANKATLKKQISTLKQYKQVITIFDTKYIDEMIKLIETQILAIDDFVDSNRQQ